MLAILIAAVVAAPPPAAPTASSKAPSATASADAEKVVCRRTANTGSRLGGSKECLTKAQWADRDVQNAQLTREIQDRGYQKPGPQ